MTVLDHLDTTYRHAEKVFAAVTPDQLSHPTPCPKFDVNALVDHAIGVIDLVSASLEDGTSAQRGDAGEARDDDVGARFRAAAERNLAAWGQPGVLDREMQMPWGPSTGERTAHMNMLDTLAHTWDLAVATGQDATLPDGPSTDGLEFAHRMLKSEYRSDGPDATFGLEVEVDAEAAITDKLVGFLGRDPAAARAADV